ncbi:MAG: urea ABC transporter ATP-binding subunit UrtE [Congregibacter sp.]
MLSCQRLNQSYGQSHTLRDLELALSPGKVFALLGRNGVGKTTLLQALLGLVATDSGEVRLGDTRIDGWSTERRVKAGLAYVPQGRMIFPGLTVEENLQVALAGRSDSARASPDDTWELFPVLKEMARRRGGDLSGGQQQQLAIARALVTQPQVLLLDEPCEGVQPNIVQMIGEVLTHLASEKGLSILLVEQKLPFARRYAQEFAIMDRGSLVAAGEIEELSEALVAEHLAV